MVEFGQMQRQRLIAVDVCRAYQKCNVDWDVFWSRAIFYTRVCIMTEEPTYNEIDESALWAQSFQPEVMEKIKCEDCVFTNFNDPWQKLTFTLYTNSCEANLITRQLLEKSKNPQSNLALVMAK